MCCVCVCACVCIVCLAYTFSLLRHCADDMCNPCVLANFNAALWVSTFTCPLLYAWKECCVGVLCVHALSKNQEPRYWLQANNMTDPCNDKTQFGDQRAWMKFVVTPKTVSSFPFVCVESTVSYLQGKGAACGLGVGIALTSIESIKWSRQSSDVPDAVRGFLISVGAGPSANVERLEQPFKIDTNTTA